MVRLRVLGGFRLEQSGGSLVTTPLAKRRAEAVVAALAVCGNRGCSREWLIALLWPESDEDRSRHGLRDALHTIRRALGPDAVPSGSRLLYLESSTVESDVQTFSAAFAGGRFAQAVKEYGGPLLDGFHVDDAPEFERWLDGERTRLAREYVEALKHLAAAAESLRDWDQAAGWWSRAVEHDPVNSHLVLQHMRALAQSGDRANAIKAAEVHARRLHQELDLQPDREVELESDRIRRGEGAAVPRSGPITDLPLIDRTRAVTYPVQVGAGPISGTGLGSQADTRQKVSKHWWLAAAAGVIIVVLGTGFIGSRWLESRSVALAHPRTAIAVLPFQNLTTDSLHGYFAGGLHDELLTQLAKVAALKVIGRTSVNQYHETLKPLREIGEELAVGSIVEGTVQVDGGRLRVVVQLLDPITQEALWAERYDRPLDDAFALQSEIARQVVAAVGARLTRAEAGVLAGAAAANPQAYDFYLQGLDYKRRPGLFRQSFENAQPLFERSLALDSSFAPAHAALALTHYAMYDLNYDPSPDRLARAQREADEALRLAPDLPESRLATGLARHVARGDFRGALEQFRLGLQHAPNDADLWTWTGRVQRDLGNWDSVFVAFERARQLDPRASTLFHSIGNTYHRLHRYREAIDAYRKELALAPDLVQTRLSLAWSYVLGWGELDTLRAVLRSIPPDAQIGHGAVSVVSNRLTLALLERQPDSILSLLHESPQFRGADPTAILGREFWVVPAHLLRGDTAAALAVLDSVIAILETPTHDRSTDRGLHEARGELLARRGRRAAALREVAWLKSWEERHPEQSEDISVARARIFMLSGEMDSAFALLQALMSRPSLVSVHYLRLDPRWEPITRHPGFQAVLARQADQGG